MGTRIDSNAASELARFGGDTYTQCFNCGNCTAVCALSRDDSVFPRKAIRYMQLGATDKLMSSTEPWLCYYCGDCSTTCPRDAVPGELMMAARRWLTSKYDWTGLSRKLYLSHAWELGLLFLTAVIMHLLFVVPENFGFGLLDKHPEALQNVQLQYFAPKYIVHYGDLILAFALLFFLITNTLRMMYFVMRGERVPLWTYVTQFYKFMLHGITQKRWGECDNGARKHWWRHWLLVSGYCCMFLLVVAFLPWFQVEDTSIHWTSYVGYYATAVILIGAFWIMIDRLRKKDEIHRKSHLSDWLFPLLLFFTVLSGILLHLFRIMNWPMATYAMYMAHMMIAVPMFIVEVPFGKWPHLLYRPMAAYLEGVKAAARARKTAPAPQVADAKV